MSLNDEVQAFLPYLRAEALARMTSVASVLRASGRMVQDEETGAEDPEWVVVYSGVPFRLGGSPRGVSQSREVLVGGSSVQVSVRTGHFPFGTTGLMDGDLIDVTGGELVGSVWRVTEADLAEQQTAVRVPVVGVKRPSEWDG